MSLSAVQDYRLKQHGSDVNNCWFALSLLFCSCCCGCSRCCCCCCGIVVVVVVVVVSWLVFMNPEKQNPVRYYWVALLVLLLFDNNAKLHDVRIKNCCFGCPA